MIVKELIEKLSAFDPDCEVLGWIEDEGAKESDRGPSPLELRGAFHCNAVRARSGDHRPRLRFDDGNDSESLVLLDMTADV